MSTRTAPTFTLRLTVVAVTRFEETITAPRWVLESDDPTWARLKSNDGNVNSAMHSEWAMRWATERVAAHSPYTVTRWIENDEPHDEGPVWTAELKRIRHDFRLVWGDIPPMVLTAKNQDDADDVERCILQGENFVRLYNAAGQSVMIGLSQIQTITYEPTEVDL